MIRLRPDEMTPEEFVDECFGTAEAVRYQVLPQILLQLYCDEFGSSAVITQEDVAHVSLMPNNEELFRRICRSRRRVSTVEAESKTQLKAKLIALLLENLFDFDPNIFLTSVQFLTGFINHNECHKTDHSTAVACLLLAYHLKIICKQNVSSRDNQNGLEMLLNSFILGISEESIKLILDCIHYLDQSFSFGNQFGLLIVTEVCEFLQAYYTQFTDCQNEYLRLLRKMLKIENTKILITVIRTLEALSNTESIKQALLEALFTTDEDSRTIVDMLVHLLMRSNSRHLLKEIVFLFVNIKFEWPQMEFLNVETRITIYASRLSTQEDLDAVLILMDGYNDKTAIRLIEIFCIADASEILMRNAIISMSCSAGEMIKQTVDILENNNGEEKFVSKTSQFLEVLLSVQFPGNFRNEISILNLLKKHNTNPDALSAVLKFLMMCDNNRLRLMYESPIIKTFTIATLFEAFADIDHIPVLQRIISFITRLANIFRKDLNESLGEFFGYTYEQLLQRNPCPLGTLVKFNILLQSNMFNVNSHQFEAIIIITLSGLQDQTDPSFSMYVSLVTTILQMMWIDLKSGLQPVNIPYDLRFVSDTVARLASQLLKTMRLRDFDAVQASQIFVSLMKLLTEFYLAPLSIEDENQEKVLMVNQPKISTYDFKAIVDFAEHYIFTISCKDSFRGSIIYVQELQKEMLKSFVMLIKKYKILPSTLATVKFVRRIEQESEFQSELEILVISLIERQSVFPIIAGLVILRTSKNCKKLERFTNRLDEIMKKSCSSKLISSTKKKINRFLSKKGMKTLKLL